MQDYRNEDVLKHARNAFAETIGLKVKQLRQYVPKKKEETNTEVTGNFIEELVRGFIRGWIGQQRLVNGTFYNDDCEKTREKPLQIDGIIHDPHRGPAIISEGEFAVVHPVFCAGVVEIKMTHGSIPEFETRLRTISGRYMHHVTSGRIMGVIVADTDPKGKSEIKDTAGNINYLFDYKVVGHCPIFILFKEHEGEYEPYMPAIDALIRASHQLVVTANFL